MRIVSRRARRYSIAVLGVAALATAALAPVAATASAEPQLVGTPVPYLIESRHAVGKVIEIGNDAAQPTLPGQTPGSAVRSAQRVASSISSDQAGALIRPYVARSGATVAAASLNSDQRSRCSGFAIR